MIHPMKINNQIDDGLGKQTHKQNNNNNKSSVTRHSDNSIIYHNQSGMQQGIEQIKYQGIGKDSMKQGDQISIEFAYQQQRMQEQEQIDEQDIEFYHNDYFPIESNEQQHKLNEQQQQQQQQYSLKGQLQLTNNINNIDMNYCMTNNTARNNSNNNPQTPKTPSGSLPAFQSSHSQEQIIKHHMEFLEAQRNKISLSQSQKLFQKFDENNNNNLPSFPYLNRQQQQQQYFNDNENEILTMFIQNNNNNNNNSSGNSNNNNNNSNNINNNNSQMQNNFQRNQSSLDVSRNIQMSSARNGRNMYSGMSANNLFNGNHNNHNDISYISDFQNNQIIQENNNMMNDSLKIEDEIQPIPIDGDMKYEDQSYLESYLLYKNSVSQLNCGEDINLEDDLQQQQYLHQQQQGSGMGYYNVNCNSTQNGNIPKSQYLMDQYSTFNHEQIPQKYYLNQTNFLQNVDDDDTTQEPQLPSALIPHFIQQNIHHHNNNNNDEDTTSNLLFNDENTYPEEKYIQDMLLMKRPNSANYIHENIGQLQKKAQSGQNNHNNNNNNNQNNSNNKNHDVRMTFIEQTKTNTQPPANRGKERSVTHNTSFEHKIKLLNKQMQQGQVKNTQQKTIPQRNQQKLDKENKLVNKENNMSCVQLNPVIAAAVTNGIVRDKSNDMEKYDQNATKIGKFISKRYINKENKKPTFQNQQLSNKVVAEATLKANEDYLNQKTKNYLDILKKHLRTDQINSSAANNKNQNQNQTKSPLTAYLTSNQQQTNAINSNNQIKANHNKLNSTNNMINKNSSPTKRLSNIYKNNRNSNTTNIINNNILPNYNTNDNQQNLQINQNQTINNTYNHINNTTNNTLNTNNSNNTPNNNNNCNTIAINNNNIIAPPHPVIRQNHSFVINQQKDEQKDMQGLKNDLIKPQTANPLLQQKTDKPGVYNLNFKNIALQRYNKTISNTMQNTVRTNRTTKDELQLKPQITQQLQRENLPINQQQQQQQQQQLIQQTQLKKNPITANTIKILQPYIPSAVATNSLKPSSQANAIPIQLFDDINLSNFKFEQEIGKGSYATVKLALDRTSQIRYALKIYPRFVLLDPHKMRNVKREIQILRKMQHPFIIKMPFAIEDKQNQIIVGMEYVGKSSLHSFLKTKPERRLEEIEVKRLFRQIVEGMNYCHKMSVVHRDIKLENILLDQSNNIKIIDFGFSIINGEDKKLKIFCGTPSYMAPEIISKVEYVGQKADIWALGILLYVMLQGKFPFKGVNDNELFKKIKKGSYSYTHTVSSEAEKLIQSLLTLRPSERPSTALILEHSWFQSL